MADRNFRAWVYTDSSGRTWSRRADTFITGQLVGGGDTTPKVGGIPATREMGLRPFPKSWRPRVAQGASSDGSTTRPVVIYNEDAPLWGALGGTINVRNGGGDSVALTVYGHEGEHQINDKDYA